MTNLINRLRDLSDYKHSDLSIGIEAADEIERLQALSAIRQEWQTIETAPKDGTHILVYEGEFNMYRAAWSQECEAWDSYCGQYVTTSPEPEFWKPLGELPPPIEQKCPDCNGEGWETYAHEFATAPLYCPTCKGTGNSSVCVADQEET